MPVSAKSLRGSARRSARENREMDWLIEDIERNGLADTAEEARSRPVPSCDDTADRQCPTD